MPRLGRWPAALVVSCLAALAGTAAASLVPKGRVQYVGAPTVLLPLAVSPAPTGPVRGPGLAMLASPELPRELGLPAPLDPALIERSAVGPLPRAAADGRIALRHYARPGAACDGACVGLIVTGLGLIEHTTLLALSLPPEVGLSFSPYADAAAWQARARRQGHEVLLDLPLEPAHYPRDDTGPLTVPVAPRGLEVALSRALAAGAGYVALSAHAGAFSAADASFAEVAQLLQQRGLGLIELGGDALAGAARAGGLPYAEALGPVEADRSAEAFARALADFETAALHGGAVLALVQPTPAGLDRLAAWLETLPAKGLRLAPPSRFMNDPGSTPAIARE